jgi:hypothetical protein
MVPQVPGPLPQAKRLANQDTLIPPAAQNDRNRKILWIMNIYEYKGILWGGQEFLRGWNNLDHPARWIGTGADAASYPIAIKRWHQRLVGAVAD